jgi:hypothetical protein
LSPKGGLGKSYDDEVNLLFGTLFIGLASNQNEIKENRKHVESNMETK